VRKTTSRLPVEPPGCAAPLLFGRVSTSPVYGREADLPGPWSLSRLYSWPLKTVSVPGGAVKLKTICLISLLTFSLIGNVRLAGQSTTPHVEPQKSVPSRIRISAEVAQAQLIAKVDPVYPPIAQAAKVSGTVVLHLIIGKDGAVQQVEFISGPQLLLTSAMDAVKQWHYKPTLLNGQSVEVDTTATVVFSLSDDLPTAASVTPSVDPQFRADVMKLLEVTHYRESSMQVAKQSFASTRAQSERSFPDLPNKEALVDAYRDKLLSLLQSPELDDKIAAVYAKYLSDDEVRSLIQFYESPAGQHFSSIEVDMTNDLGQAAIQLGRERIAELNKEFCGEHAELRGKISFCPLSAGDSSPTH
jgi:TonB family protein